MKQASNIIAAAVLGLSAVAMTAPVASAAVVCNADSCWHTHHSYSYRPEFGVTVHPNNWRWGANDHYSWHEHSGRGYWRNGAWITF